ncbi:MAG: hypothetical protein V1742_00145 [Pseudomonadota bacterium]
MHVDQGQGFIHLGNIMINKMTVEPKNTELEIPEQLSGEELTGEIIIIKRQETYKFPLQEITPEHLRMFYCGGAVTPVGAGTAAVVDQKLALAGELPASLGQYSISAVTVRQFLDKVFVYDGSVYTDKTVEADSLDGTAFDTLIDGGDALYLGKATPFKEVYIDFAVPGSYGAVVMEYWNGSAWAAVSDLAGAAAALAADGKMNWTLPTAWVINAVNGSPYYWIKITATTPWTTPATINEIRQNAVRNTDYVIDPGQVTGGLLAGRIGRLAAGFLADGEEVMVSYTHATWTILTFAVGTVQYPTVAARMDFLPNKGTQYRRHIPKCQLKPDGNISFDAKNQLLIPLVLEVLSDFANNPTAPYGRVEVLP